jgi:hypothetical protein
MSIENYAGAGLTYNPLTQKLDVDYSNLDIGDVSLYRDKSPRLGEDLNLHGKDIIGTGNININGTITGKVKTTSIEFRKVIVDEYHDFVFELGTQPVILKGVQQPDRYQGALFLTKQSRGSIEAPTAVAPNDVLTGIISTAHNGKDYVFSGSFGFVQDPNIPFTDASKTVPGYFEIRVPDDQENIVSLRFNSKGTLEAPMVKVGEFFGNINFPKDATAGCIIFDSESKHFYGFNGAEWKQLDN